MVPADPAVMGYSSQGAKVIPRQGVQSSWNLTSGSHQLGSCSDASYSGASGNHHCMASSLAGRTTGKHPHRQLGQVGRQRGRKDIKRSSPWCWLGGDRLEGDGVVWGMLQPGVFSEAAQATMEEKPPC